MDTEKSIVAAAFRQERKVSAQLGYRVRLVGILLIGATLTLRLSGETLFYYLTVLAVLAVTGWLFYRTTTRRADLVRFVVPAQATLVAVDMILITAALVIPGPGSPEAWPDAMQLRLGNVGFLFVFLAFSALTYSPGLALWAGAAAGGAWLGGVIWLLSGDEAFTLSPAEFTKMDIETSISLLLDPNYVSFIGAAQEAFLLFVVGVVIAAAVWRGRKQAIENIEAARERAKLARYFSPDVAEELLHRPTGLDEKITRRAVVVFADLFKFTTLAETQSPSETIDFLREFHRRATGAVFAHDGTVNKFIGDEVMISFGAIHDVDQAETAALNCARDIAASISQWSEERRAKGLSPVRVGVGVHVGDVVVGNIGDMRCLELAVLGDVVNTASRLQKLTRDLDVAIIASREVIDGALNQSKTGAIEAFTPAGAHKPRGRDMAIDIFKVDYMGER